MAGGIGHAILTIHEIVAPATELDRIVGCEVSGNKLRGIQLSGQAQIRLEAV